MVSIKSSVDRDTSTEMSAFLVLYRRQIAVPTKSAEELKKLNLLFPTQSVGAGR